ncbi:MAG: hypothetical protein IH944_07255 [Armatimonadetes bacterium]|nr:hypothetical protein [Armatimonadota bacterium]
MKRLVYLLIASAIGSASASAQVNVRSSELNEATFSKIRAAILLNPSAAQWETIPWQPELGPAITEARKQDKPILLWMMNGNPVGMT